MNCAGLAALIYVFFKYIASDDEEGSRGMDVGGSANALAPASRNGAASAPVQPPPQGRWSQPLKLIMEAVPKLPSISALVKQRLPIGGGAGQSAEGGSQEAEGANLQEQAAASASRPGAGTTSTEQVSLSRSPLLRFNWKLFCRVASCNHSLLVLWCRYRSRKSLFKAQIPQTSEEILGPQ